MRWRTPLGELKRSIARSLAELQGRGKEKKNKGRDRKGRKEWEGGKGKGG